MNPISTEFANELNASPWMGVIYEAGFGIPFQANYLNIPGASKTVLFTGSLYNKAFQPVLPNGSGGFQRSVSNQMVEAMSKMFASQAELTINLDIEGEVEGNAGFKEVPPLFSLMVSGAQSGPDYRGASHGWVNLGIVVEPGTVEREPVMEHYAFHFFNHKTTNHRRWNPSALLDGEYLEERYSLEVTREEAGAELCKFIQWFMEKVLLEKYISWDEAINSMPKSDFVRVDVIRAKDIWVRDHLKLAKPDVPLVYDGTEFKRPVDYLRKFEKVFRGSFNPPTVAHMDCGAGALFEISLHNARKGKVNLSDAAERVGMLAALDVPVLITDGLPTFVAFDDLLIQRGGKGFKYILGVDTFNAVVSDKFNPTDHHLGQFYGEGSSFLILPRNGEEITMNERTEQVEWETYEIDHDPSVSSTEAREGNLSIVPEPIRSWAAENYGIEYDPQALMEEAEFEYDLLRNR